MLPLSPSSAKVRCFRHVCLVWCCFVALGVNHLPAQNLVNNGSFEQNTSIPINGGSVPLTVTWQNAGGSPDYFHTQAPVNSPVTLPNSWQAQLNPYHGQAVLGMYAYISNGLREYVRTQLNTPMQPGQMYRLSFAITRGNVTFSFALTAGDGFGALLSTYPPASGFGNIPAVPQWELNQLFTSPTWVKTTVDIWPDSAYEYLTFGNFNDNANTNVYPPGVPGSIYMFLDSVALVPVLDIVGDQQQCTGDTVTYYASPEGGLYSWTVNGLPAGTGDSIQFVMGDSAQITLTAPATSRTLAVTVIPGPSPDLGPDRLLCDGDSTEITFLQAVDWSWTWSDGSQDSSFIVTDPGWVWVRVDSMGCPGGDSLFVDTLSSPLVELGNDTILCSGDFLSLSLPAGDAFLWHTGATTPGITVSGGGVIWGEVANGCGTDRDSLILEARDLPAIRLPEDTSVCDGDSILISSPIDSTATIFWNDLQQTWTRWAFPGNTYFLEGQNECGLQRDTINVGVISIPAVGLPDDRILCEGELLSLQAQCNVPSFSWEDGSTALIRQISAGGLYSIRAANECGEDADSILITGIPVPEADLGGDTTICRGEAVYMDVDQPLVRFLWEDGSEEPFRLVTEAALVSVRVVNMCGEAFSERRISIDDVQFVTLPPDTILCEDEPLVLTKPSDLEEITWPDGSTDETFMVMGEGSYAAFITNTCGTFSDTITVTTKDCECVTFIPSAFSPNDDGENDAFMIGTICDLASFSMTIYDRWGREVVSFSQPDFRWTGRGYPEGVYLWRMETEWEGTSGRMFQETRSGTLTLFR